VKNRKDTMERHQGYKGRTSRIQGKDIKDTREKQEG